MDKITKLGNFSYGNGGADGRSPRPQQEESSKKSLKEDLLNEKTSATEEEIQSLIEELNQEKFYKDHFLEFRLKQTEEMQTGFHIILFNFQEQKTIREMLLKDFWPLAQKIQKERVQDKGKIINIEC